MRIGKRPIYVGITGFMNCREVEQILEDFGNDRRYKVMIGVLASLKTLEGRANKWPKRYPPVQEISSIFTERPCELNLIHYATDRRDDLLDQLERMTSYGGLYQHGFQLNITWPDPRVLESYRKQHDDKIVVLQINRGCFESVGNVPGELAKKLRTEYQGLADYLLLDASGGLGKPLDIPVTRSYIQALQDAGVDMAIAIAGGFCAENVHDIMQLERDYWPISIDAEGKLRNEQDDLDLRKTRSYLRHALDVFDWLV
ncbi:hypothetical protein A2635_03040 [Candidatus Peribacteria bacterium RIFCSPHIGHO2_01_FULL_51_9]|nr:MAG: hypothetical protein A2635_03040 [Candidatus Peribacteria bacterium RIFCSPHIGHO2_01_FULL_51_9]